MSASTILNFLVTALAAGLIGGAAMELTMWLIARKGWAKGNMLVALGSLFTHARTNAFRVGMIIHAFSAVGFAMLYAIGMMALSYTTLPYSLLVGLGFGFVHGMLVSLALVWVVADQHPLEEFKEADLAIGLCHLAGHVTYGGVVGLVVGAAPL
jgi:hypothetical protein